MNSAVYEQICELPKQIGSDHVFNQRGQKVGEFKKRWDSAVAKAGLGDLHFHDLRHTFSTWLSELGYNPLVVMALTGHTSSEMLKKYTNISDPTMTKAVEDLVTRRPLRLNYDNGEGSKKELNA